MNEKLIRNTFRKGLIIDTKPLLFLIQGNKSMIDFGKNEFTKGYSIEQFLKLKEFLKNYTNIIITPQILAEISNLINNKIPRNQFKDYIEHTINEVLNLNEVYIKQEFIFENNKVNFLGFTDISIFEIAKNNNYAILTKDWDFYRECLSSNLIVIHLDQLFFN